MRIAATYFALAAAVTTGVAAVARDWPETAGWDIAELKDDCALHQTFAGKGETELTLFLQTDGLAMLVVGNDGWSIKKGEKADLTYVVNGHSYSGGPTVGISDKHDPKKAFATKFGADFVSDFAAAPSLLILKGDVIVDRLSLSGSGAAVATAKRCSAKVRTDIAAAKAEKRRYADIADDPFAKSGDQPDLPGTGGGGRRAEGESA